MPYPKRYPGLEIYTVSGHSRWANFNDTGEDMTIAKILNAVQFVVDSDGQRRAVQVDLDVWQEIVSRLQALDAGQQPPQIRVTAQKSNLPDEATAINETLLKILKTSPDNDKDEGWWAEFEQELRENRLTFPEVSLT